MLSIHIRNKMCLTPFCTSSLKSRVNSQPSQTAEWDRADVTLFKYKESGTSLKTGSPLSFPSSIMNQGSCLQNQTSCTERSGTNTCSITSLCRLKIKNSVLQKQSEKIALKVKICLHQQHVGVCVRER